MIILLTIAACCTADQAQNQAQASHNREVERKSAQQIKTSVQRPSRHPDASSLRQSSHART